MCFGNRKVKNLQYLPTLAWTTPVKPIISSCSQAIHETQQSKLDVFQRTLETEYPMEDL